MLRDRKGEVGEMKRKNKAPDITSAARVTKVKKRKDGFVELRLLLPKEPKGAELSCGAVIVSLDYITRVYRLVGDYDVLVMEEKI